MNVYIVSSTKRAASPSRRLGPCHVATTPSGVVRFILSAIRETACELRPPVNVHSVLTAWNGEGELKFQSAAWDADTWLIVTRHEVDETARTT